MRLFLPFSGKGARLAIGIALALPALLFLDLKFVSSNSIRLLASNALCVVMVGLAAVCCWRAARVSTGYPRQLWTLLVIAFALETGAQAVSGYYQSFVPASLQNPVPSDILFFVWAAPVFMTFVPRSSEDSRGFDGLRFLDFLQVAIVVLTIYLYFFYSPSRWQSQQPLLVREILLLYSGRDLVLAVAFFARWRASRTEWLRSISGVLAFVFVVLVVSDIGYLSTIPTSLSAASWVDLVWMSAHFLVIVLAVGWKPPEVAAVSLPPGRVGNLFATQLLPVGMPLLVIFMSRAIAEEQFILAWLAVTASVLCSSVRLILTNRVQQHISGELLNTEKALRSSEELLSSAFRSSPDSFSINVFPDGPYLDVNESFTRQTGYTRDEVLGKSPSQMNLWVDPGQRTKLMRPLAENGEVRNLEMTYRTKGGQVHAGLMSACIVQFQDLRCSLVIVRDITDRKEAEDILRTSEERFRSLIQNLHVGIVTYDPNGRIAFANRSVLELFGLSLEHIIGKRPTDLGFQAFYEDGTAVPDERRPVRVVLENRRPSSGQLLCWRVPNRAELLWTLMDTVPEFNSAGELVRIVVSFTDVTEQRRATAALRESEQRFRTLVQNLHAAVILHRPDGRVAFANPAAQRIVGLEGADFVGKLPSELGITTLSEDGRPLSFDERPVTTAMRTRVPVREVMVGLYLARSNKTVWVYGSSVPQVDQAGTLIGSITSFVDMTEQRRANDALRESEERFRTLVRDLHVAVVLNHPDGSVEYANPAAYNMFGLPEGSATGKFMGKDLGIFPVTEDGRDIPLERNPVYMAANKAVSVEVGVIGLRYVGNPGHIIWAFGNVVPQRDPSGKVIRTISSFADITEMRNAQRAVRKLSTELLRLQDEERRRIGRELHDGLAQTVLAINLNLAQARQSIDPRDQVAAGALDKARTMTQQMSREIRTLSYLLHPPLLDDLGLLSALKEYVQGFSERSGIQTSLEAPSNFGRLPQPVELALFRVVQESLGNIQRHSGSASAIVRLGYNDAKAHLEVIDFGRGMSGGGNGGATKNTRLGVGIPGMRERVSQLGGRFEMLSGATGTIVRVSIPVPVCAIGEEVGLAGSDVISKLRT